MTNYGATIGPHNGGLRNPGNPALVRGDYDYWHWGPDEALDVTPPAIRAARRTRRRHFRTHSTMSSPGCAASLTECEHGSQCYFNWHPRSLLRFAIASRREDRRRAKALPLPALDLSTGTPGKHYCILSEPVSDWFVNGLVAQSLEPWHSPAIQTSPTMHDGVDFYYNLGALINFYSHTLSTGLGDAGQLVPDYISYSVNTNLHPRLWKANALSVYQWWLARSNAQVTFNCATNGYQTLVNVLVTGAADPNTAVEVRIPGTNQACTIQVWTNGNPAASDSYRVSGQVIKLRVGTAVTNAIVSYYPLGQSSGLFSQNFDSVTAPSLPPGWTTAASGVETPFVTQASGSDTAPNSAFVPDPGNVGLSDLISPVIAAPGGPIQLSFRHNYDLEPGPGTLGYDGGVLEIKIGTSAFTDILAAGGSFLAGGYNRVIDTPWQSPIAGRQAWSGTSAGYVTTLVSLPAISGQSFQLRWRCGTDNGNGNTGWHIDTVSLSAQSCLC